MSVDGDKANLRAPEERNVYSKSESLQPKSYRDDRCIAAVCIDEP